jgi:plastocyanin
MRKGIWLAAALVALLPGALVALGGPPALAAEKTRVAIVDVDTPATKWHYEPNEVRVAAGSTVVWRNEGNQPHTVTSDKTADNKSFNSSYLTHGQEWEWTFSTPGEYSYYCEPHNWMRGVLHVTAASSPTAPPATQPTPVTSPTTSTASTPKPTAAPATTTTRAATTTTKASSAAPVPTTTPAPAAPVPTTTPAPAAPVPTTTPAPAAGAPAEPAAVPATTSPPAVQEEAAAPPGGNSGRGKGNPDHGDDNPVAIALASMATLGVTVIAGRMLLSKPR